MRNRRQELILQLVEREDISTQEQLLSFLNSHGEQATQATISRDIKLLGLQKNTRRGGRMCYEAPNTPAETARRHKSVLGGFILSVSGAGNIVCVRCSAGMAQGVCAALDANPPEGMIGSLAGEDTIFLLCRGEDEMHTVREEIIRYAAEYDN